MLKGIQGVLQGKKKKFGLLMVEIFIICNFSFSFDSLSLLRLFLNFLPFLFLYTKPLLSSLFNFSSCMTDWSFPSRAAINNPFFAAIGGAIYDPAFFKIRSVSQSVKGIRTTRSIDA